MKKHSKVFVLLTLIVTLLLPAQVFGATEAAPAQVKHSKVYSEYSDRVTIKWSPVKGATKYRVYYKPYGQKKWAKVGDVSGSKTSYTHVSNKRNGLKAGKKYTYTVRAYNQDSQKWGKYDTKGKNVIVSTTVRNKVYYYHTRLNRSKGGRGGLDGKYWMPGTTKVTGGTKDLTFYSSFLRSTKSSIPAEKKYFLKYQKRTFKLTPQTTYYMGSDKVSRKIAVDCMKRLNGLGLTLKVKNNTIIQARFNS